MLQQRLDYESSGLNVQLNREGILDGGQPPYYNMFAVEPSTFKEANHAVVPHRQKYG